MTVLSREKCAAAKQFLANLKDFYGIDAHALKPKTRLDEFWKLEAADVFAHLLANNLRLKDSDEEKIRARFQKAKDALLPLETQIERSSSPNPLPKERALRSPRRCPTRHNSQSQHFLVIVS